MFEEAQLYSPVTQSDSGAVVVHLGAGHPGFNDPAYRDRRNEIAASALSWAPPAVPAPIEYADAENEIWALVCTELEAKHERYAVREFLDAKAAVDLPVDRVPQLVEVTARLAPLTRWAYHPAPGLVGLREFYGSLAEGVFHSTQYVRHPSQPLYTPEPDIIHEVIGHGNMLGSPRFAALKRAAGEAVRRLESDAAVQAIADVFWFTLEFGVMYEAGELRAYGAGILSSYGEIEEFRAMEIRPLDVAAMATVEYDITSYQPVLFAARSMDELEDVAGGFFESADDDTPARLGYSPPMLSISHHERVEGHPHRWHVHLHGRKEPIPVELPPDERRNLDMSDEEIHALLPSALERHAEVEYPDAPPEQAYSDATWDAPVRVLQTHFMA